MSSFTSKTVRDLYEVYNSVYVDKTELFLNDILDEVTDIINHFVNEGYDFSEYSWDELYESFLENVLEPELEEVENFITQLNESTEELTEEQIENLLENPILRGLLRSGPKVTGSGGVTIPRPPRPQPIPGTGKPLKNPRQLELPVGQDKGTFQRIGDWVSSLAKTTNIKPPAAPRSSAPAKPAAPTKPPTGQPKKPFQMPDLRPASQRMNQGFQSATKRLGDVANFAKNVVKKTPEFTKKVAIPATNIAIRGGLGLAGGAELINQVGSLASGKGVAPSPLVSGAASAARLSSRAASALADKSSPSYASGFRSTAQQASNLAKELDAYNIRQEKQAAAKDKKSGTPSPSPAQPKPKKLLPGLKESPDWNSAPKPKGVAVLTLGSERKVFIPGQGWQFPKTARRWARAQGYHNWDKIPNPPQPAKPAKPAAPAQTQPPAAQPPAPRQQAPAPAQTQPQAPRQQAPAPAQTQRPPAPKPQAPAQTGDRTKDLTTWALANKGMIDKVGTKSQREILKAAQTGGSMPAPRPLKASLKDSYDYDAFDFVLEYLLSEGHTDTLEEALYVMMEMDPETIQSICEAAADQSNKQIDKGVRKTYAGQAELDNQRSRGLNKLPATQRAAKEKRMRARLKARRDDLFGERNRREDAAREEIRKKYGL